MRVRDALAALVLGLCVVGEWVPVAVIDRGPEVRRPQGPQAQHEQHGAAAQAAFPAPQPLPATEEPIGPPGPQDDVITIRRTVGDSYSNKKGVVVPPAGDGSAGAAEERQREDDEMHVDVEDDVEVREDTAANPPGQQAAAEQGGADAADGLPLEELREAHRALLKQSTAPVSGKLDFLRRLKNKLLRHIASLMPQTAMALAGVGSGSPSGQAEGRGHKGIGFPSNEGTLMSLAFLVFAVFLVKVVLQLIYAVQNSQANAAAAAGVRVAQMQIPSPVMPASMGTMMGTMMNMVPAMMPPMMAAMEPAMAMRGRARREAHQADGLLRITANVMEAIGRARDGLARVGDG